MLLYTRLLVIVLLFSHFVSAQRIYISEEHNGLYRLDIATCATHFVCQIYRASDHVYDIALHPNGILYGLGSKGALFEIDTITGNTQDVHQLNDDQFYNSLEILPDGDLLIGGYALFGNTAQYYKYDVQNNISTSLGSSFGMGGDFLLLDSLVYGVSTNNQLILVDLENIENTQGLFYLDIDGTGTWLFDVGSGLFAIPENCNLHVYGLTYNSNTLFEINLQLESASTVCHLPFVPTGATDDYFFGGPVNPLHLNGTEVMDASCGEKNGAMIVSGGGGAGPHNFYINDFETSPDSLMEDLSPGIYHLKVENDIGCTYTETVTIENAEHEFNLDLFIKNEECDRSNGVINILVEPESSLENIQFSIDKIDFQNNSFFEGMQSGYHTIYFLDSLDCLDSLSAEMEMDCPVYIPNTFSPNGDEKNDLFRVFTNERSDTIIEHFSIYDRWGEKVFESKDFSIHDEQKWWDGTFKGKDMDAGVFVYKINVLFPNGQGEGFIGEVTLLR